MYWAILLKLKEGIVNGRIRNLVKFWYEWIISDKLAIVSKEFIFRDIVTSVIVGIQRQLRISRVASFLMFVSQPYKFGRKLTHEVTFEVVWTVVPGLILVLFAVPSIKLLYSIDFILYDYEPILTIKVVGHQWFWSYEYSNSGIGISGDEQTEIFEFMGENVAFDSYMQLEEEVLKGAVGEVVHVGDVNGHLRLLDVDNPLVLPSNVYIRFNITAVDVLHSWAVPSLGIKVDAVPGRINQSIVFLKRSGVFYGQCSEICGINHGFMPIQLIVR